MENIETGIDKLVELIKKRGKVSLRSAAKELGVSKPVALEWAELLEEENIVTIEYGLMDSTLSLRKIGPKEVEGKKKEFLAQKDVFVNKIDNAITTLDFEHNGLKKLQKEFDQIKKDISDDLGAVRDKVQKLDNYHKIKHDIDKEMISQKSEFENYIGEMNKKIDDENSKYAEIIKMINLKESEIEREKKETEDIEMLEESLRVKLNEIIRAVNESTKKLKSDSEIIGANKNELKALKKKAEEIKNNILDKKTKIEKNITKSKDKEGKISDLEGYITTKISAKTNEIRNNDSSKKLGELFEKKNQIQQSIMEIEKEHNGLEHDLKELRKKAIAFRVVSGKDSSIVTIESEFNNLAKKKDKYQNDIKNLFNLIQ
jgi:chromosome segregation ATPase